MRLTLAYVAIVCVVAWKVARMILLAAEHNA